MSVLDGDELMLMDLDVGIEGEDWVFEGGGFLDTDWAVFVSDLTVQVCYLDSVWIEQTKCAHSCSC